MSAMKKVFNQYSLTSLSSQVSYTSAHQYEWCFFLLLLRERFKPCLLINVCLLHNSAAKA